MADGFKDKLKSAADKVKGEAKVQYGKATDDTKKVVEGEIDKAKGEAKQKLGDVKNSVNKKDE